MRHFNNLRQSQITLARTFLKPCLFSVSTQQGLTQKIIVPHNASQPASAGLASPTIITTVPRTGAPNVVLQLINTLHL